MSSKSNISARIRYLIIVSTIAVVSIVAGSIFLHTMNMLTSFSEVEKRIDGFMIDVFSLDHQIIKAGIQLRDTAIDNSGQIELLKDDFDLLYARISELSENSFIREDSTMVSSTQKIAASINGLEDMIMEWPGQPDLVNEPNFLESIHEDYIQPLVKEIGVTQEVFYNLALAKQKTYVINLFMVLVLAILFITVVISLNVISTNQNLRQLRDFVIDLEKGHAIAKINLESSFEFADISESLNRFIDGRNNMIAFLKTLGDGISVGDFSPGPGDEIGNEIKRLAERLNAIQKEQKARQTEDQKKRWATEGIALFAELMRSEREDVTALSYLIIQKLVSYLEIEMGAIFITSEKEGETILETIASYAYERRKYIDKTFRLGEGLPGTCALEKEKIYMDEVPEDYSDVISGVGNTKPRYVLVVPLRIEEEIFGVLELASFRGLEPHELDFVDQLAESIASTLMAVKTNEQTAQLLEQSRQQAEKLLRQEEEMKKNLEDLKNAQEESRKKESEITGMLNAMNESSLVAEFSLTGRFTHVNEKFLKLMESPSEMILGRHHSEFIQTDTYSETYKQFWESLRSGESFTREERLKMISGKELWLRQTYTPIMNKEGKVYKILNIAVDITNTKLQQENLEKQSNEIIRQNLEMESLNRAVNTSIIRCELDHDGIILNTNKNYETVTGLNRKEFLGRNYRLFLKDQEKDQFEKIWKEITKGKTYQGATRRTRPTGEEVWLMSTFSPVKDEEGKVYKYYLLALDITEKKLKYQLLEEANKEIERLKNA